MEAAQASAAIRAVPRVVSSPLAVPIAKKLETSTSPPRVAATAAAAVSTATALAAAASAAAGLSACGSDLVFRAADVASSQRRRSFVLRPDFEIVSSLRESGHVASLVHDLNNGGQTKHTLFAHVASPTAVAWSSGACRIRDLPNAGGNSMWSEVLSFEVLSALFGARLVRTEMELEYEWPCKITDYSVRIFDQPIGVSVTRAIKFRGTFTEEDALMLLSKKLLGVKVSSRYVLESHGWRKQILHVLTAHDYIAEVLERCFDRLDPELRSNTVMIVTRTHNADWIF